MKYANLIHNGLAVDKENRIVNLGDAFELIAIDQLYYQMGVTDDDIIMLDLYELEHYQGEEVILPINFMFMPQIMGVNLLNMSSKIIPVFLGLALTQTTLSEEQISFLRKWEPIGTRDERTKNILCENGIKSYIGGCLVSTLSRKTCSPPNEDGKVAFIDVPRFVEPYVPDEIRKKIVFLDHEFFVSYEEVMEDTSLKRRAAERIQYYEDNISLIVTSRFHGAVIGLALGIPVILAAENNFYKFSWLSKLLPFYDRAHVSEIDWHPHPVDIAEIKQEILEIAKCRICHAYVTHYTTKKLQEQLCNADRDDSDALRYISSALSYVDDHWDADTPIKYAIWGINDNAIALHKYIKKQYPKAVLTTIYDGLQERKMAGLTSIVPSPENISLDTFVFVTSNTASRPAEELFKQLGKTNYFLCKLEFIKN